MPHYMPSLHNWNNWNAMVERDGPGTVRLGRKALYYTQEIQSVWLAATSHCKKLRVCTEIRVNNFVEKSLHNCTRLKGRLGFSFNQRNNFKCWLIYKVIFLNKKIFSFIYFYRDIPISALMTILQVLVQWDRLEACQNIPTQELTVVSLLTLSKPREL